MQIATIRSAQKKDCKILTTISYLSKRHWNYPDEYFEIWKNELEISEEYIDNNQVFIAEDLNKTTIAYYSIIHLDTALEFSEFTLKEGYWLEHMFVSPEFIGQTIGTQLVAHLRNYCLENLIPEIRVLSDPNSIVFYKKLGFQYIRDVPSSIKGRTTPELLLQI